jgi:hypothetical protein
MKSTDKKLNEILGVELTNKEKQTLKGGFDAISCILHDDEEHQYMGVGKCGLENPTIEGCEAEIDLYYDQIQEPFHSHCSIVP